MPKSLEELREIKRKMEELTGQLDSALSAQRREYQRQSEAVKAEGQRRLDAQMEKMKKDQEDRDALFDQVLLPARNLSIQFRIWDKLPKGMKEKTVSEISELVGRAQKDDGIARQILDETKKLVAGDKTIKTTTGLPSLDWRPKTEPSPKP